MTAPAAGAIRLYMSMSLDGFVVGPQHSLDAPMGVGGFRLFNWLDRRFDSGPDGQVFAEVNATRYGSVPPSTSRSSCWDSSSPSP